MVVVVTGMVGEVESTGPLVFIIRVTPVSPMTVPLPLLVLLPVSVPITISLLFLLSVPFAVPFAFALTIIVVPVTSRTTLSTFVIILISIVMTIIWIALNLLSSSFCTMI